MIWRYRRKRAIVLLKPNAKSTITDHLLVQGTKQSLPAGGIQLLSVIRNTGGKAIRRVDRSILDSEIPDWHNAVANNTAEHYVFDEDAPENFYVYPPQTVSPGQVELNYATAPTDLAALGNTIDLNDIYGEPILDYVLYRAYLKDSDYAGSLQRAANHFTAFNTMLGNKVQVEFSASPNSDMGGRFDNSLATRR